MLGLEVVSPRVNELALVVYDPVKDAVDDDAEQGMVAPQFKLRLMIPLSMERSTEMMQNNDGYEPLAMVVYVPPVDVAPDQGDYADMPRLVEADGDGGIVDSSVDEDEDNVDEDVDSSVDDDGNTSVHEHRDDIAGNNEVEIKVVDDLEAENKEFKRVNF